MRTTFQPWRTTKAPVFGYLYANVAARMPPENNLLYRNQAMHSSQGRNRRRGESRPFLCIRCKDGGYLLWTWRSPWLEPIRTGSGAPIRALGRRTCAVTLIRPVQTASWFYSSLHKHPTATYGLRWRESASLAESFHRDRPGVDRIRSD